MNSLLHLLMSSIYVINLCHHSFESRSPKTKSIENVKWWGAMFFMVNFGESFFWEQFLFKSSLDFVLLLLTLLFMSRSYLYNDTANNYNNNINLVNYCYYCYSFVSSLCRFSFLLSLWMLQLRRKKKCSHEK